MLLSFVLNRGIGSSLPIVHVCLADTTVDCDGSDDLQTGVSGIINNCDLIANTLLIYLTQLIICCSKRYSALVLDQMNE